MKLREIVLDTETTGLSTEDGDRITEIGCIELINSIPTGKNFHQYINPERDISAKATEITGLTREALKDKPRFFEIADAFLDFIGTDPLIIHNAKFDMGFLNFELGQISKPLIEENTIIDTLDIARKKFPGAPASLDALCRRFDIDNSNRTLHGALLDAELLAEVYLELTGGRQQMLILSDEVAPIGSDSAVSAEPDFAQDTPIRQQSIETIILPATAQEAEAHRQFIENLPVKSLWLQGET